MARLTMRRSQPLQKSDVSSNGDGCHKKRNEWQKQVQLTAKGLLKEGTAEETEAMVP